MKNRRLFSPILFFLCPMLMYAGDEGKAKHTEEKTIKKEFVVNKDATLKIDNSFGNLNVVTWTENRIVIEVHITTKGDNEEAVQRKLDNISVEFQASPALVSAETIFDRNENNSFWDKLFQNNSVGMEIDYLIKMPITNNVDLSNDYGNINLARLNGRAVIHCDYGKITTEELMADNNVLTFDYSDNCYFEFIKSGSINADYSGFTVAKTKSLEINADYTDIELGVAKNITFNCDYGEIEIDQANNIKGDGDYLGMRFGKVYKNLDVEGDYGSIEIGSMMGTAEDVVVHSDYTDIEIGVQPDYHFNFSIDLEYTSLDAPDGFEFSQKIKDSNESYYEGHYGESGTRNSMTIESDYGSVEIYVNRG